MITPNFDRDSKFDSNAMYQRVIFGASYLTEVDLNEMQQIYNSKLNNLINLISKGDVLVSYTMNGNTMNDLVATSSGSIIKVDSIDLSKVPNGHSIYLDITPTVMKYDSTIYKNGYAPDGEIENNITDPLFPGVETSRREQLVIKLVTGTTEPEPSEGGRLLHLGERLSSGEIRPVATKPLGGGVTAEDFASKEEAEAGTRLDKVMTPLRTKEAFLKFIESVTRFSLANHNHDTNYSSKTHNHEGEYAPKTHDHPHNHDSSYAPKSHSHTNYAQSNHTHSEYSPTNHGHGNKIKGGTNNFAGDSVAKTFAHGMGAKPSAVTITPNVKVAGDIGEWGCTFDATNITVYNTGSATSSFSWIAVVNF